VQVPLPQSGQLVSSVIVGVGRGVVVGGLFVPVIAKVFEVLPLPVSVSVIDAGYAEMVMVSDSVRVMSSLVVSRSDFVRVSDTVAESACVNDPKDKVISNDPEGVGLDVTDGLPVAEEKQDSVWDSDATAESVGIGLGVMVDTVIVTCALREGERVLNADPVVD
jgi:hypothetical protein